MTLRLTVQREAWEAHVDAIAATVDGLVPVVKGNGYGFGRATLHPLVKSLSDYVCVGTVHELDHIAERVTPVVLTPASKPPPRPVAGLSPILTVGSADDVRAIQGWNGRVIVKLQSSMRRFGVTQEQLEEVVALATSAALTIVGYSIHLPLAGTDLARLAEVEAWLDRVESEQPFWLSHLQPQSYAALRARHPDRQLRLRLGTALWHGDKSFLHLAADAAATHEVKAGDRAGYQLNEIGSDATVVVVTAGSAHGVAPLANGSSPFHFERTRLALLEPPHMHSSMLVVPRGTACPRVGERVDVQRPLITTMVDEIEWV